MSEVNLKENYTDCDYETLVTRLCILTFRCRIGKTVKNSRKFTNELREFLLAKLIKIENPLLTQIKYEYTDVYIAVMTLIEEFEKSEKVYFDANELGFICLHIAAAMNRAEKTRNVAACLICEGGLTISTYLKSKIERQFNEIEIIKIVNQHELVTLSLDTFALIFNSAHTRSLVADHVIAITPMLDEADQEAIRAWIINREYQKIVSQNYQIKNNILFFQDKGVDRDLLLTKYCKLLEVDQHVGNGFLASVLEREKRASTSLGRGIAVPHGSGFLVKNSIILVIRLDEPIAWDGQSVDLIFLIAINFNENKNYHYFFEKLFRIISNDVLLKELKTSSSTMEMATLLFKESEDTPCAAAT